MRSSLHLMDSDDATILAKSVDMEFGDFEEEPKQHVSKRLRLLPPSEVTDVAMVVADAIKATLMAVKEELAADRAAAHASNSHVLSAQPKALAEPDPSHFFCVNGHTVKTVCTMHCDGSFTSCSRACTAFVQGGGQRVRDGG